MSVQESKELETNQATEVDGDGGFGAAFDEVADATQGGADDVPEGDEAPKPDDTPEDTPEDKPEDKPEDAPAPGGDAVQGDDAPAPEPEPQPAGDPDDEDPAVWKQRYKTLQGMFKAEVAREVGRQLQARDEPAAPKAAPADAGGDATPEDADAEAVLNEAMQDFPHLMKAVDLLVKRTEERIRSEYAPVANTVAETARERHFAAIRAAHSDFDTVKTGLAEWVEKQPSYLRPGYEAVLSGGTAEDVIDLVARFKESQGIRKPVEPPSPRVDATRRRQAEAAEVVRPRGAVVVPQGEPDPDDYESAFEAAASRHN